MKAARTSMKIRILVLVGSILCPVLALAMCIAPTGGADLYSRLVEYTVASCLSRSGDRQGITGDRLERVRTAASLPNGIVLDASSASWSGYDTAGKEINWPIIVRGDYSGGCWHGGNVSGAWDENGPGITWENPYHRAAGLYFDVPEFTVEGINISDHGDGIVTNGRDSLIKNTYMSDIHDDCIQNDKMNSVQIEDSFFDGCYTGFSARNVQGSNYDGRSNRWLINDSLVRLEPQPVVWRPRKNPAPGHGGFFKFDKNGKSPKLTIRNTVFRADQIPNHGALGIPPEVDIESCSNNTIVWLGRGAFPDTELLPGCFSVTTNIEVWNRAVDDWQIRNPGVR